jgi:hypothetical protein
VRRYEDGGIRAATHSGPLNIKTFSKLFFI